MTRDPRIEVQRRVHALFTQKFASGEPITKEEVQAITQWKPKTLNTYWSKQFRSILAQRPDGVPRHGIIPKLQRLQEVP